ncbi:uncharacterized protein LOC135806762 [Sycon ciliatum]|uniref:uncharacterized protein LOC135806762 n=1 Tax=Sycon ciliatum TaxID=27933 RepID=UPI0031F6B09B
MGKSSHFSLCVVITLTVLSCSVFADDEEPDNQAGVRQQVRHGQQRGAMGINHNAGAAGNPRRFVGGNNGQFPAQRRAPGLRNANPMGMNRAAGVPQGQRFNAPVQNVQEGDDRPGQFQNPGRQAAGQSFGGVRRMPGNGVDEEDDGEMRMQRRRPQPGRVMMKSGAERRVPQGQRFNAPVQNVQEGDDRPGQFQNPGRQAAGQSFGGVRRMPGNGVDEEDDGEMRMQRRRPQPGRVMMKSGAERRVPQGQRFNAPVQNVQEGDDRPGQFQNPGRQAAGQSFGGVRRMPGNGVDEEDDGEMRMQRRRPQPGRVMMKSGAERRVPQGQRFNAPVQNVQEGDDRPGQFQNPGRQAAGQSFGGVRRMPGNGVDEEDDGEMRMQRRRPQPGRVMMKSGAERRVPQGQRFNAPVQNVQEGDDRPGQFQNPGRQAAGQSFGGVRRMPGNGVDEEDDGEMRMQRRRPQPGRVMMKSGAERRGQLPRQPQPIPRQQRPGGKQQQPVQRMQQLRQQQQQQQQQQDQGREPADDREQGQEGENGEEKQQQQGNDYRVDSVERPAVQAQHPAHGVHLQAVDVHHVR